MIRKGISSDIESVSVLWLDMVHELAPTYEPNVAWWKDMAIKVMESGSYHLWVSVDKQRVLGFIDGFLWPEPATGHLHAVGQHFYVVPEYRGTEIASLLYRTALHAAVSVGVDTVEMFCFEGQVSRWEKKGYLPVRHMMRKELHLV